MCSSDLAKVGHSYEDDTLINSARNTADDVANHAGKGCNGIRRASQFSRTLCAITAKNSFDSASKIWNAEILEYYFKYVARSSSFKRPSIDALTNLFHRMDVKSAMNAASPSF